MSATTAIGIICKVPEPGKSKTRLRGLIEGADAAALSAAFIRDVAGSIEALPEALGRKAYAVYAPVGSEAALQAILPATFDLLLQADCNLGAVLREAALALVTAGHDGAILVNSDSPTLPTSLLADAVASLRAEGDRVVLGPAIDGGYYLIGLKRAHDALFQDIPWSTSEVLARTVERAAAIGLPVTMLPTWYDIDEPETFAILEAELEGRPPAFAPPGLTGASAPATRSFLQGWSARPNPADAVAAR